MQVQSMKRMTSSSVKLSLDCNEPVAKRIRLDDDAMGRYWQAPPEVTPTDTKTRVELPDALRAKIVDPKSFNDIPIIDLQQDEATLVNQMRYACEVVGFMQVVGHGISTELQEQHKDMQKRFFSMSQEEKQQIAQDESCPVRGYFGKGAEDLDNVLGKQVDAAEGQKIAKQSRKDHKEGLDMNGVPWSRPKGGYVADIFGMQSQLPAEESLSGFREVMEEYSHEMFQLSRRVLSLMALALGQPRDLFEEHLTRPVTTHRLLHYWPMTNLDTEIGVGEHTDYGLLTVLKQDMVGGLQVLNAKDSKWVHCLPVSNAFVINLGDMLGRWTGHRFKSTVHRVVNTSTKERFSVPYFVEPNMDTVIDLGALCPAGRGQSTSDEPCGKKIRQHGEPGAGEVPVTAEHILERFYRASGQLRVQKPSIV